MKGKNETLPIGWQEVPTVGDPLDSGTPEEDWKTTAYPRHPCKEIRLWMRGERYVRICEYEKGDRKYSLNCGWLRENSEDSRKSYSDELKVMLIGAKNLMRAGGY